LASTCAKQFSPQKHGAHEASIQSFSRWTEINFELLFAFPESYSPIAPYNCLPMVERGAFFGLNLFQVGNSLTEL